MNKIWKNTFPVLIVALSGCNEPAPEYTAQQVPFNQVKITGHFWRSRLEAHAHATLETCIAQTQDSTERINNFIKAAGLMEGGHEGIYFDDSDVYKAMEGIAYSLVNNPNPEHEALLDKWIGYIAKAQQPDGYLNTFYTLNHPEDRCTDMEKHEMYCGGHMIEAAVAHHKATGKSSFLNVATRYADYLCNTFGPGKKHWVPGHEEIELALVKLYHETGEKKYLDLSYWLLEERGHGLGHGAIWDSENWGPAYCQDDVPVSEISDIKGHAVRAMYLFSGMADVAAEKDLPEYTAASVNGKKENAAKQENGYVALKRSWKKGDKIELDLEMPVEVVAADPRVEANVGKRAIQRGPLVYCVEESDQANKNRDEIHLSNASTFETTNASGTNEEDNFNPVDYCKFVECVCPVGAGQR